MGPMDTVWQNMLNGQTLQETIQLHVQEHNPLHTTQQLADVSNVKGMFVIMQQQVIRHHMHGVPMLAYKVPYRNLGTLNIQHLL